MIIVQKTALCLALLVGFTTHGQTLPNQVGTRYFGAADTDGNTMSRISIDGWVHNRTPESNRDNTKWDPYYNVPDLSVTHNNGPRPMVKTTGSKGKSAAFIDFEKPVDVRNRAIKFQVRASDWKNISDFSVLLSSDGVAFERTITLNLKQRVVNPTDNEWITVLIPVSSWETYNDPDLSKIKSMLWKTVDNGNVSVATEVKNFQVVSGGNKSVVSITIDDGDRDSLYAKKAMSKYGFKGSIYVDPTVFGNEKYMTDAEVKQFARDGWDVSGHQINYNLKMLSDSDLDSTISKTADYLKKNNFQGANVFALPNGVNDERVNAAVARHYDNALNIDGVSNLTSTVDNYRINRHSIDRWTTVEMVKGWIDTANKNNEWLILNFHVFSSTEIVDENVTPHDFEQILAYLKTVGIEVKPVSAVLNDIKQVQVPVETTAIDTITPRPLMIGENDRQDWGVSVNNTTYKTSEGNRYTGQGITGLANYHNGAFSLVGELGVGQLNNISNKNFLLGDMTATYKINKNLTVYGGLYGDAVDSDAGLASGVTFTGVNVSADLEKNGLGGVTASVYQQQYSNNNTQNGFIAKAWLETPIDGVNVYVSTKQYTNSLPDNGLYYSPADYQRYNVGVGFRRAINDEWTVSGHVDFGQAVAAGQTSNVSSYRVAFDKTLAKNMSAGIAVGSDINPSNNYRYNYVMANLRYTF